jgi:hypothetical protein
MIARSLITTAALAAGVALAAPAPAQAPDPAAVRAATAVVDLNNPPARAKAGLDRQIAEMRRGNAIRAMFQQNPRFQAEAAKNTPAFNAAIARMGAIQADAVGPVMAEMQAASRQIAIESYARAFSVAELEQLATFFRSPVGQKLIAQQQPITQQVGTQVAQRFGPRMEAAQRNVGPKLEAELKKLFPDGAGGGRS